MNSYIILFNLFLLWVMIVWSFRLGMFLSSKIKTVSFIIMCLFVKLIWSSYA